jgi:hypothetical protein
MDEFDTLEEAAEQLLNWVREDYENDGDYYTPEELKDAEEFYEVEDSETCEKFDYSDCQDMFIDVFDTNGNQIDYMAAENSMDKQLLDEVYLNNAPCNRQLILTAYAKAHKQKFGEDFAPYVGGEW